MSTISSFRSIENKHYVYRGTLGCLIHTRGGGGGGVGWGGTLINFQKILPGLIKTPHPPPPPVINFGETECQKSRVIFMHGKLNRSFYTVSVSKDAIVVFTITVQ